VAQPGRYLWHEGMRVADLIPSRDTLITREYWNAQNTIVPEGRSDEFTARKHESRIGLSDATIGSSSASRTGQSSNLDGESAAGASSGSDDRTKQGQDRQDLRTEVKHGGSEINWEYAVIERLNKNNLTTELIPFNLGNAIDQRASRDNQPLAPGDVVTVFSQEDVPVATENRSKFVQVAGEVKAPGVYRVDPGETLRDVVARAGGLASHAYLYGSELLRESAKQEQRLRLAQMVERMQRELSEASAATASLSADDRSDEQARLQEQRGFIERLARVQPQGRVVLQLKPRDAQMSDIPAMPLEDGDIFTIPAKGDTVQVLGSVYNENTFRFRPGQQVAAYLNSAGGPTRGADTSHMFVIRADGSVYSRRQESSLLHGSHFTGMRLMPGDAIVVPQRFKTRSGVVAFRDWTQIFAQLALGAAAVSVIK